MARIVVPLDGSTLAEEALPWGSYLARSLGYTLHLLSVGTHDYDAWAHAEAEGQPSTESLAATIGAYLEGLRRDPVLHGVAATTEVRLGKVTQQVGEVVAESDTRLVVLTSHGRGGLQRFIQGSVADVLVRTLCVPILVLRPGTSEPPVKRILITLDGSETAEVALDPARALARATGAAITLLRVANPLAELPYAGLGPSPDLGNLASHLLDEAANYLAETAREDEGREVRSGRPLDVILDFARESDCSVIAMGTHGRGGVLRLALGSTADAVTRAADRPVLLVPERTADDR